MRRLILLTAAGPKPERVLAGSPLIDIYFSSQQIFAKIETTIANRLEEFEVIATLWMRAKRKQSVKDWVKTEIQFWCLAKT